MDISAIVFNTKKTDLLEKCLKSVDFTREIILVNNQGTEESVRLGRKYAAKIVDPAEQADYVEQIREWGCAQAQYPWRLVLDGDEEITPALAKKLVELADKATEVWFLPRLNMILGHTMKHTGLWPDYQPRFYRKGKVIWKTKIHEKPQILGEAEELPARPELALIHHNYQTVDDYLERIQKYTKIEAELSPASNLAMAEPTGQFYADFLRRLLKDEGYKDGMVGSFVAISQAYYQMVVAIRRFEKTGKRADFDELKLVEQFERDLRYWINTQKITNSQRSITKIGWRLIRKLGI